LHYSALQIGLQFDSKHMLMYHRLDRYLQIHSAILNPLRSHFVRRLLQQLVLHYHYLQLLLCYYLQLLLCYYLQLLLCYYLQLLLCYYLQLLLCYYLQLLFHHLLIVHLMVAALKLTQLALKLIQPVPRSEKKPRIRLTRR
jgi:hypothetical protein